MEKPTDGQGPNTKAALKHARRFARSGNRTMTQIWIDRACQFSYVTQDQLRYMEKLLKGAKQ